MSPIRILLLLLASFDLSFSISIGISRNPGRSILRAITDTDLPDVAVELNSSNFDPFLRESSIPFAIVEFFAHWCPACRNYKPHYEKVARLFNGPHAVHPGIVLMTRVDCALKINTKLCDRFSIGHYPMLLWGPPSKFASGRWEPRQDKGDIKSIDDGRTADRLLNWINQQMSSTFSFDDEKYENEHLFWLKASDPGQVARAIYDVEEATDEAFDIILEHKTDTSLEAARQRIQEQLSAATAEMVMLSTNEQDEKAKQSKKVVEKNAEAEPPKKSDLSNGENGNKVGTYEEIKSYLKNGSSLSQLSSFLHSLSGSPQEVMNALFEALFEGVEKGFAKEVGKKKNYLATAMQDDQSHMYLLNAIEAFCSKSGAGATKEVALVIKVLYDGDVLEEEHIVRWFKEGIASKQGKNSQIWKNMKPFIEWLQSAESESVEE